LKESRLNQKREEEISSLTAKLVESKKAFVETQTSRDEWEQKHAQLQRVVEEKTAEF